MFLCERAQGLIEDLRGAQGSVDAYKASICDAMSIVMNMYQMHATGDDKVKMIDVIDVLSNYNELLTELSKEK